MSTNDSGSDESSTPVSAILLSTLAGLSVILCLPALVTHVKFRNFAAASLVLWITLVNVFNFINPIIWPTDQLEDRWNGVGLCDIEVKLIVASSVGMPGALICIFRQLATILDVDKGPIVPTPTQRRRRHALEICCCIAFPVLMMVVHYLVQPLRFYIFAITGCVPPVDHSWPAILLVLVPPLALCAIAAGYCILVVIRLLKCRRQFSVVLESSASRFNRSRFLRLFILSAALMVIFFPLSVYVFARNLEYPRRPFSWSKVHPPNWPDLIQRVPTAGAVRFDRWVNIGIGFSVFFFFGLGTDAKLMYRSWLLRLGLGRLFPQLHHPLLSRYRHNLPSDRIPCTAKFAWITKQVGSFFKRRPSFEPSFTETKCDNKKASTTTTGHSNSSVRSSLTSHVRPEPEPTQDPCR